MRTWQHDERLLRRPKTRDSLLGRSRDAQGQKAARTFSVSLSSVKRYVQRAEGGGSLAPKEKPGAAPKLDGKAFKLLEEDLKERPFATLRERCEYIGLVTGIWVSRSTMWSAIALIGPTGKKGGRVATQRDEFLRAAWRVMLTAKVAPERLVFVDECGTHTSMAPIYGYAPKGGERSRLRVPRRRGKNTTLLWSMTLSGMGPSLAVEGATTARVFEAYVKKVLAPSLQEAGQVLIMDDLEAPTGPGA